MTGNFPRRDFDSAAAARHFSAMSEHCESENCCQHEHEPAANGVANPRVLDALGIDPETGEVVLVMFEPRPWKGGDEQLFQLQEKLNSYMSFALDGEMAEQLPQTVGKKVRLTLACAEEPPPVVTDLLLRVREQISLQGINLTVEGLNPPQEGGCGTGCGCH
ncbi:MAG: hypothetical protein RL088_33 [Verrucomicrobiota bacterium]